MFNLHDTQKIAAIDPHRFRVLCCGRRFGKTTLAIDQMKARAAVPNSRIAYVAPTYQQARDIAWEQLKKDCRNAAESINESRLEIRLINGSLILLRGWEAIETLRGQKFDLIILDEVAMMKNFWLNWQEVLRPTLTDTKGEAMFISTPKGFNHFYDLYNSSLIDVDFKSFHFSTYDNPHIPRDEIETMKKQMTPERFSQEIMAEFTKTEGLVFKEFSRDIHLYDETDEIFREVIAGVDFGFTNPAAAYSIGVDHSDNYWIHEEFYKKGKTDREVAEYVAAMRYAKVYPDPESAGGIEEMRRKGVNVQEVIKGKGSIERGIDRIRELLKTQRVHIHSSCLNLISELETYSYPDKRDTRNPSELPIDENNHAIDAS